jgi:hypothetical protein
MVYLIMATFGQYESVDSIVGIFTDPQAASENRIKYEADILAIKSEPCPIPGMDGNEIENIYSESQWEIYFKWQDRKNSAEEFVKAYCTEMETNKLFLLK